MDGLYYSIVVSPDKKNISFIKIVFSVHFIKIYILSTKERKIYCQFLSASQYKAEENIDKYFLIVS